MEHTLTLPLLLLVGLGGCGNERPAGQERTTIPTLESSAFRDGERIPQKYTADGADVSPPLTFSSLPAGTRELALICEDPDAPTPTPWVHWILYAIAPAGNGLPEDFAPEETGARSGRNSWPEGENIGWRGPAPPGGSGVHRYIFTLYALGTALELEPGATCEELRDAFQGHVLGEATLTGLYSR